MRRLGALWGVLLLVAATASAQSVPTDHYRLQFYPASADPLTAAPLAETPDIPVTMTCNQVGPIASVPIAVDPMLFVWDDPVNAGRSCVTNQGPFVMATLPVAGSPTLAGYLVTITAFSIAGDSSARVRATNTMATTVGPGPPPPPPGLFVIGQPVTVIGLGATVWPLPDGVTIGGQSPGALGVVTGGPAIRTEAGKALTVWTIDFATGVDGWAWEDRLMATGPAHPAPTGIGIRR